MQSPALLQQLKQRMNLGSLTSLGGCGWTLSFITVNWFRDLASSLMDGSKPQQLGAKDEAAALVVSILGDLQISLLCL